MPLVSLEEFLAERDPIPPQRLPDGRVRVSLNALGGPEPEPEPGFFGAPFKRGLKTVQSDFTAVGGLVADVFGYDEAAQGFYNRAAELSEEAGAITRRVPRVEDIKGPVDTGIFALESIIENAPLLASIAIPGLTAAKIAGFAGRGALKAGGAKAAAELAARKQATGTIAAFLSDVGLQTGESAQIATEAGADPLDLRVVGSGLGKGALDFVPITVLARRLGLLKGIKLGEAVQTKIAGQLVERGFIRRAVGNVGTLIAYEVPTEVAQEIINISLDRSIQQFEGELSPEEKSQLLNAAGGAAAFGLLGIPAAVARPSGQMRAATEEELTTGEEAANPTALNDGPKLLPAPALRVTPEGVVLPPGVETASYPVSLDTPRTGTAVAEGVAQALGREPRQDLPVAMVFTDDGIAFPNDPDTQTVAANAIRQTPELQRTPMQQAIVQIDDARGTAVITDTHEIPVSGEAQRQLPPVIQTLVQMRDDIFLAPELRRKADGQLTKAAQKRIVALNKRIEALSERMGLPNPLTQQITQEIRDAEKQLPTFNAEEAAKRSIRPDSRLTTAESAILDQLEEERTRRSLADEDETFRRELVAKREGAEVVPDKKLTAEQVTELETQDERVVRERTEAPRGAKEMSVDEVTQIVRALASNLTAGPEVIVADSKDTNLFPKDSPRKRAVQGKAKGAFFLDEPGRIYIFADRHADARDVVQTFAHEVLGHQGLRAFFSPQELRSLLETVYRTRGQEIQSKFGVPRDQSEALRFAEEFIAEIAENGTDQTLLARVIAALRRALRKIAPRMKFTDGDLRFMLRDVSRFLSGQIPGRNRGGLISHLSNDAFMRVAGQENIDAILPPAESLLKVWGTKFLTKVLTPLQLSEVRPILGSSAYIETVQLWSARVGTLIRGPDKLAHEWTLLPAKEQQVLSQAVLEAMEQSDVLERKLTQEEEIVLMRKLGASKTVFEMFKKVGKAFDETLNLVQRGLEKAAFREAARKSTDPKQRAEELLTLWEKDKSKAGRKAFMESIAASPTLEHFKLGAKLSQIENEMAHLRDRNYFPRMRFGQYASIVRATRDITYNGRKFKGPRVTKEGKSVLGEVVSYETFDTQDSRAARRPQLAAQFKDQNRFKLFEGYVSNEEYAYLGMPPALFDALETRLAPLSDEQKTALKELFFRYSPGKAFLRHLTRHKGIEGYSTDALRVFATYMMNASHHVARIEFGEDMAIAQDQMRSAVRGSTQAEQQATTAGIVQNYFNDHFRYIMNPENDWATARSWGFLFYLGFNVKSAVVNLTQVPMVAYPFLAHHYGDATATAALLRSMRDVVKWRTGKLVFDNETDAHLQRGIAEGILDQSYATSMAGLGESDYLQRLMPTDRKVKLTNDIAFYGSFLFKHAEKFNREVTFIAARELALKKNPNDQEAAYKAARKAVQATMFEYSKWNRPAFMRGKKSVLFLFWQFMQHLSFMAYGGEGKGPAARVWVMLLLAAGLQGLPFAENIFDILDFGGTEAKELLGLKDPQVTLREDLRDFVSTLTDRPDLIMHGLSRNYGLGPLHLLGLLGVPVPNVDISGSLSAGRFIPGTEALLGEERDPNAKLGRTMAEVLGPVMGVGFNIIKALDSDDPDTWKVWERALPTSMQGISKSIRRQHREEENFRGGGAVVKFNPLDIEQRMENVAQFFSFATTRVNQRFELRHSQEELKRYWVARHTAVMENYAWAIIQEDKEGLEMALKRLRKFNKEAPAAGLRIDSKKLKQSVRERFRRGHLREIGVPSEKAFRGLFKDLEEAFPEGAPQQ